MSCKPSQPTSSFQSCSGIGNSPCCELCCHCNDSQLTSRAISGKLLLESLSHPPDIVHVGSHMLDRRIPVIAALLFLPLRALAESPLAHDKARSDPAAEF